MTVLKCPFCGGEASIKGSKVQTHCGSYMRGWVGCPDCGVYIQWTHDAAGAVKKWNRRVNADERNPFEAGRNRIT